jgi:hypothetical protein
MRERGLEAVRLDAWLDDHATSTSGATASVTTAASDAKTQSRE